MISEAFDGDVYIMDFTEYNNTLGVEPAPFNGVMVSTAESGIVASFVMKNPNRVQFMVVNNEKNPAVFTREDGTMVSNCECIVHADRHDNRKGWMLFLELKYCKARNLYQNMLVGIRQLKDTCNYILKEKKVFDESHYKKYLVISTPGVEPLDPFDASYFVQEDILSIKEETGALLRAVNKAQVQTPAVIKFG
ncbi:MAG: hypothetical protein K5945_01070 [Bacteroidaceae bacterium]|nr:hypothetical protein [Bacteroidaceae bacterium]